MTTKAKKTKNVSKSKVRKPKVAKPKPEKEEATGGNVVPPKYRTKYGKDGNCGDEFAEAMAKAKKDEVPLQEIADANGVDLSRWAGRNAGMVRMNLGNVLRGMHRKGTDIVIGKVKVKGAKQEEKKVA